MLHIMEHQSETSTESCSLPPTPGKGVCDTDNDTEQYPGAQEDKSVAEKSVVVAGQSKSDTDAAVKVQNEVPMFLLSHNGGLSREFLEDQGKDNNFTDLDLICCDGYIQVHRCVLMGASKFLRDLMIDKDILDTTAITLPDISIRHLRMVVGILYTGTTLVDECDEMEVFQVMNVLGLPVAELLCRTAKTDDMEQVTVLRHVSIDMENCGATCSSALKECSDDKRMADQEEEIGGEQATIDKDKENVAGEEKVRREGTKECHVQQITSTTCDMEAQDSQAKDTNGAVHKNKTNPDRNKENAEDSNAKSPFSDLDDLNFEEACNSLQMQVAKPLSLLYGDGDAEMNPRKRKSIDDEETVSVRGKTDTPPKTKKVSTKSGISTRTKQIGTKVEKDNDESDAAGETDSAYSVGRRSLRKSSEGRTGPSAKIKGRGNSTSQSPRIAAYTPKQSNGTVEPLSRVFLETKELQGVKYNIYGFADPVNGAVQPGKTIAIMASTDKNKHKK